MPILTENCHGSPRSPQLNAREVPQIIWYLLPSTSFPIHPTIPSRGMGFLSSAMEPTQLYPRTKQLRHEANRSPSSSDEVKNLWSCTCTPLYIYMVCCSIKHKGQPYSYLQHISSSLIVIQPFWWHEYCWYQSHWLRTNASAGWYETGNWWVERSSRQKWPCPK